MGVVSSTPSKLKVIVIGGGNAAGYVAKAFVDNGALKSNELCIIGEEPVVAYERPALSKGFLAPEGAARLPGFHTCVGGGGERQAPDWYTQHGIQYMTSTKVTAVDVAAKTVTLSTGATLKYDKLIVAMGARALSASDLKLSGAELGGIHYLRDEQDGQKLYAAIKATKEAGGKAVVVGGGYIGMECAAAIANHSLAGVTMVFPSTGLLSRLLTPQLFGFYEKFYQSKGITLVKGGAVHGFEGEGGKVKAVLAKVGGEETRLEASLVVVGVGARPNTELFAGQLEMAPAGGIKVDGTMRTSAPDVYAIGDCCAFTLAPKYGGATARQEHVTHARSSAAHAVKAILGSSEQYDYLPYFYSRVFSLGWQFYGVAPQGAEVAHFGDFEGGTFGAYWVCGGKVVGVFLESGSAEENAAAKRVALEQPAAPSLEALAQQGTAFALSPSKV